MQQEAGTGDDGNSRITYWYMKDAYNYEETITKFS